MVNHIVVVTVADVKGIVIRKPGMDFNLIKPDTYNTRFLNGGLV